jgi:hypothetical protein
MPHAEDLAKLRERVRRSRRMRMAAYLVGHLSALAIGTIAIGPPGGSTQDGGRLLVEFLVFGIVPLLVGSSCEWLVDHLRRPTVRSYLGALLQSRQGHLTFRIEERKSTRLGEILGWLLAVLGVLIVLSGGQAPPALLVLVWLLLAAPAAGSVWTTNNRLALTRRQFDQLDASPDGLDWWGPDGLHERLRLVDVRRVVTKRGPRGGRTEITTWTGERREIPSSYIEPDAEETVDLQTVIEIFRPGMFRRSLRLSLLDAFTDVAEAGTVQR